MDPKYHIDVFERLLKERSDEFRIYPSDRVWRSVYNNIHPARKWPSVTTTFVLLGFLFLLGFLNPTLINKADNDRLPQNKITASSTENIHRSYFFSSIIKQDMSVNHSISHSHKSNLLISFIQYSINSANISNALESTNEYLKDSVADQQSKNVLQEKNTYSPKHYFKTISYSTFSIGYKNDIADSTKENTSLHGDDALSNTYMLNKIAVKKWADKLTWQLYAVPSIVYGGTSNNNTDNNLAPSSSNQNINNSVWQKPSVGIEAGTALLYSISKKIKLKAGLQLNYSQYNVESANKAIPTFFSNLTTDGTPSVAFHNEIYQISLPVGMELKLVAISNKIQLNAGVTLQPTYVIRDGDFVQSMPMSNDISNESSLNSWGLNAGFETFISYKASNGYTWKIGPAVRYQLFSTYNNAYATDNNLTNYGVLIGVSRVW